MWGSHAHEIKFDFFLPVCLNVDLIIRPAKKNQRREGENFPSTMNNTVFVTACPVTTPAQEQSASLPLWSVLLPILLGLSGCLWLAVVRLCQTNIIGDKRLLIKYDRKSI